MSTHALHIESAEGRFEAYVVHPRGRPRPVIVVLHETFGIDADMHSTCEALAAADFIAVCPELFWRLPHGVHSSRAFDLDAGVRDVEAAVTLARAMPGANGRVGVMGFCLGGLLTFLTAARTRVDAAAALFGERFEEFLSEAPDLDAPFQVHLAHEDEVIPKIAQQRIIAALQSNPRVEIHGYPGCGHAFSRHGGMHYDADAARLSRARTFKFFQRHL